MFTTANRGLLWVEAEGAIYSVFDQTEKRRTFFDGEGVVLENYSRPHIQETDSVEIDDPDFFEEAGEGFYIYTTHEVTYDVDGRYGLFGLKYLLRPRWHRKSFRFASRFPMPTTPEQPDFAHGKFLVFCSLQPTKSACSAATEKCLSGVGQPLSSVSGRKRYNTLDFPKENRVPTGMLLAPIGNPEPRSCAPLDTPYIFLENGTQTVKYSLTPFLRKYKTELFSVTG